MEFLDKDRAFALEAFDNMSVVDDLVTDIDRRLVFLDRPLDDVDGPHDSRTETPGLGEYDLHRSAPRAPT
jgi:hypothetical protein